MILVHGLNLKISRNKPVVHYAWMTSLIFILNLFTEVVAIGPCGLDYHKGVSDSDAQKEIFKRQVRLACDIQKPILIHERSAHAEVMEILSRHVSAFCEIVNFNWINFSFPETILPPRIVRSFMGTVDEALIYLQNGFYISLTGFLCKVSKKVCVKILPQLIFEFYTIPG